MQHAGDKVLRRLAERHRQISVDNILVNAEDMRREDVKISVFTDKTFN